MNHTALRLAYAVLEANYTALRSEHAKLVEAVRRAEAVTRSAE